MNAPANISFEDALKARYAAAKARTFPGRTATRQKPEPAPVAFSVTKNTKQTRQDVDHSAHMEAWHVWKAWTGAKMSPQQFFVAACWLAGYTPEAVRAYGRNHALTRARRAVIRSLAHRFPKMTSPQMKPIVNRDHTTILYCMGQTERGNQRTGGSVRKRSDQFKRKEEAE